MPSAHTLLSAVQESEFHFSAAYPWPAMSSRQRPQSLQAWGAALPPGSSSTALSLDSGGLVGQEGTFISCHGRKGACLQDTSSAKTLCCAPPSFARTPFGAQDHNAAPAPDPSTRPGLQSRED